MSRSRPGVAHVLDLVWRARATAIVRCDDQTLAGAAMDRAVRAGLDVVEFTLTTPGALALIEQFAARGDVAAVGAGTVLTVEQAEAAVAAGASFLVSPVTDAAVIARAAELGVAAMPGAHTATELYAAHRAGAPLQKLFPAPAGGPAYLRSLRGPLPMLRVVPTNGVDLDNLAAWFAAGAYAVGFVTALFDPAALAAGDLDAIEARARALRAALDAIDRPSSPPAG